MWKYFLACISLASIVSSQDLECKNFDVRREINFTRMLGRWNGLKIGTYGHLPNNGMECFKVDLIEYFPGENETSLVSYFSWPIIDDLFKPTDRINGIKIPNINKQGEWKLLFSYMEEHVGVYILHTDYNTALVLGCAEDAIGDTDVINYIGMMSRDTKIDDSVVASYKFILGNYGIDVTFDDFDHENCTN